MSLAHFRNREQQGTAAGVTSALSASLPGTPKPSSIGFRSSIQSRRANRPLSSRRPRTPAYANMRADHRLEGRPARTHHKSSRRSASLDLPDANSASFTPSGSTPRITIQGPDFISIPATPPPGLTPSSQSSGDRDLNPPHTMSQRDMLKKQYTHHVTLDVKPAACHRSLPVPSSWTIRFQMLKGTVLEKFHEFTFHGFVVAKYGHPMKVLVDLEQFLVTHRNLGQLIRECVRDCVRIHWDYQQYRDHCLMPLAWGLYRWAYALDPDNASPVTFAYYNQQTNWWQAYASVVPDFWREEYTTEDFHRALSKASTNRP